MVDDGQGLEVACGKDGKVSGKVEDVFALSRLFHGYVDGYSWRTFREGGQGGIAFHPHAHLGCLRNVPIFFEFPCRGMYDKVYDSSKFYFMEYRRN